MFTILEEIVYVRPRDELAGFVIDQSLPAWQLESS